MRPSRKNPRLGYYNYATPGYYFVTICSYRRRCTFSTINGGLVSLSPLGHLIDSCWQEIPEHYNAYSCDSHVIMPNHIHGLLFVSGEESIEGEHSSPPQPALGTVVNALKASVSKLYRSSSVATKAPIWQRNYYERVVRDDDELYNIRKYIQENPLAWQLDKENPQRRGDDPFDEWLSRL